MIPQPEKRSSPLMWILTITIAALALYFSLRGVAWRQIGETVEHADGTLLCMVFVLATFAMFVRSLRWGVLLSAEEKVPISTVFWATAAGYLGNSVLPARAGELLRTQIVSARTHLSRSYVFATALTGLAMDVIVLVVLSAGVIATLTNTPPWLKEGSGTMAAIGLVGMAVLVILPHCESLLTRLLGKAPVPDKFKVRLVQIGEQFLLGLRAFHHVSRFAMFAGISFSVWFLDAIGAVLIGRALHIELSFGVAMLLLAGLALASSAPSTPGYVGIYQAVAVGILPAFGISKSDAIAYILVFQGLSYAVFLSWGFLGLWQLRTVTERSRQPAAAAAREH